MSNVNVEELISFLKEEKEKNEQATKKTMLIGGLFGVFLFCYLFWLNGAIRGMLNPEDLAAVVYGQVDENLPNIISQLESGAALQGPVLAKRVSAQLASIAPSMRVEGEMAVDRIFGYLPVVNEEMKNALEAFAVEHKKDIGELVEANGIEPFAVEMIDLLFEKVAIELNTEFQADSPGQDLVYLHTRSLDELKSINSRLEDLLKKQPYKMSRSELIQKRLIGLMMSVLDDTLKEGLDEPKLDADLRDL